MAEEQEKKKKVEPPSHYGGCKLASNTQVAAALVDGNEALAARLHKEAMGLFRKHCPNWRPYPPLPVHEVTTTKQYKLAEERVKFLMELQDVHYSHDREEELVELADLTIKWEWAESA